MGRRLCLASLFFAASAALAQSGERTLFVAPTKPVAGETRHALVIGNGTYANGPLRNPVNDARAMAKVLGESGFNVMLVENGTQGAMQRAIRTFGDKISKGGVGLFYYAGHGIQTRGRNYLIPVNAEIEREYELEFASVDVNLVLAMMDSAKNGLNIVILDACRNNPFGRGFRSMQTGLAQMEAPTGTFIAFATAPGSVAADGKEEHGVYTKHLLAEMIRPGMPIELMFKQVRNGVMAETKGEQIPWESSSLRGEFSFHRGTQPSVTEIVTEALRREREASQREMDKLIASALERQRQQFEAQGMRLPDAQLAAPGSAGVRPTAVAAVPAAPAPSRLSHNRFPQPGDTWTYRLTYGAGAPDPVRETSYVVKVAGVSATNILDHVIREGAPPIEWAHSSGHYLVAQVVSVFSPYLAVFEDLKPGVPLRRVTEHDDKCFTDLVCQTEGRVIGKETVRLKAGTFDATKVLMQQNWWTRYAGTVVRGTREITVWYSEEAKRAVRVTSRTDKRGRSRFLVDFDLELASYQVN